MTVQDTVGLGMFWRQFQALVAQDDRSAVMNLIEYPIHLISVAQWNFSIDCDTARYTREEPRYLDADVTVQNALTNYDLLFTKELKAMIASTDVKRIIEMGYPTGKAGGIVYVFIARNYGYGCGSDLSLKFYCFKSTAGWRVKIS